MDSVHQDHDLEQVLARLRTWEREVQNFRNDGWVSDGYRKRIEAVAKAATEITEKLNKKS